MVWTNLCWAKKMVTFPPWIFFDLIFRFLQVSKKYKGEIFSLIAWLLWNRRNAICLCKSIQPAQLMPSLAGRMLQDFLNAQVSDLSPVEASPLPR